MKLTSAGVLSSTPGRKLIPGTLSVVAQVTETVGDRHLRKEIHYEDDGPGHHSPGDHLSLDPPCRRLS
jgi:hypothetical protein